MNAALEWDDGLCNEIALLDYSLDEAERVFGAIFSEDFDDLDRYDFSIFFANGMKFALQKYRNSPSNGIVLISSIEDERSPIDICRSVMKLFNIEDSRLVWIKPN